MNYKGKAACRDGAAAVEFAFVAPVVFLFVFSIFELARLVLFSGNVNTALLTGLRHATLAVATPAEVDETIRLELRKFGIGEAQINFTPPDFDGSDTSIQIDMEVPLTTSTGIPISEIRRSVTFSRETQ